MSQSRFIGRFKMNDGRVTGRVGDTAEKMELARFPGHHVVAEREGEDLVIYQIGDNDGLGVLVSSTTTDRAPKTMDDLQRLYDRSYERRDNFKQRADRHSVAESFAIGARSPAR